MIKALHRQEQIIYYAFFWCIFLTFQPFKVISYWSYLPFVFFIMVFDTKYRIINLKKLFISILVCLALFLLYNFIINSHADFLQINFLLSISLYGHYITIILLDKRPFQNQALQKVITRLLFKLLLIQGVVGLFQLLWYWGLGQGFSWEQFKGAVGDSISGTMARPWSAPSVENIFFVFNMIALVLYCSVCCFVERLVSVSRIIAILTGIVALLVASSVLLLLFIFIAISVSYLMLWLFASCKGLIKTRYLLLYVGIVLLSFLYYQQPIVNHSAVILQGNMGSARIAVTYNMLSRLHKKQESLRWFGKGPGQMVSKASWLRSGYSFVSFDFEPIPFIGSKYTDEAKAYLYQTITDLGIYQHSSIHTPFYTFLGILSEFGIIGVLVCLTLMFVAIVAILRKVKKYRHNKASIKWGWLALVYVVFFSLASLQAYSLEISQAIFIPALLAIMSYSNMRPYKKDSTNTFRM